MDWNLLFSSYANVFLDPTVLLMTLLGAVGGVLLGAVIFDVVSSRKSGK